MVNLLGEYTPDIQRFSCDECFLDFTNMDNLYPDPIELANEIKNRIEKELGFTVNIGISTNKLLARVASYFTKPNKIHTLFLDEIGEKMWPLDVRKSNYITMKSMGNSTTTHFDITTIEEAHLAIGSLCETLGMRFRKNSSCANVISVHYKTDAFFTIRKQRKLLYCTDSTQDFKKEAFRLFDEL